VITGGRVGFDLRTVLGVLTANVVALFVGHLAVLTAIRTSGGTESLSETFRVLAVSSVGTVAAALLGVGSAVALVAAPELWWVGLVPVVLVFVAYRAYVAQSQDKGRVQALFDAATTLHQTPQIDLAVEAVASRVLDLVKAEMAVVVLTAARDDEGVFVTVVDTEGRRDIMIRQPTERSLDARSLISGPKGRIASERELLQLGSLVGRIEVRQALLVVLFAGGESVGFVAGIDRLGDVSAFDEDDLRVLATLGSQLSTTLENGRLTDTLAELQTLKGRLESLIESKDRLVASVSHELRTPLAGVIGLAAVIRESADETFDAETLNMLDLIVEQGNELSNIIEDLLTHARAEAGTPAGAVRSRG
jgi:K+-sensing histidine kinase KdpD